jgi:hypothetical protein
VDSHRCRVCGLWSEDEPWGPDGRSPTYFICDCCGAEAGYEDVLPAAARTHREGWLARGAPWFWPRAKPDDWDLDEQLRHVPEEFR